MGVNYTRDSEQTIGELPRSFFVACKPMQDGCPLSASITIPSSGGEHHGTEIDAAVVELVQALHEEIGHNDTLGIERREFVDLAAEFGVQRPKAFAAAADMGFGDDDYISHPFPIWFERRGASGSAVMKDEFRDILVRMFGSLAESSQSRLVDRRRRRPSSRASTAARWCPSRRCPCR